MGDGIKRGKQTNEALGHLAYWLSKRCPTLPDKLCERFLHAEFPRRNEHRWFTIQRFAVYRGDASRSPAQIGVRTETVSAAVLGRIDGKIATLRRVFQTVSQSAARQFEATRAGALDFVDANDADEATAVIDGDNYAPRTGDQRRVTARQIRERRGQRAFRDALRRRYGGRCAVTGCTVLDLLEAAHIKPYRGDRDNNPQNGLLLRADIHTLFDLDLLGIEPE